jgi:glycosyltransferase involved in cell wall biosynthesis
MVRVLFVVPAIAPRYGGTSTAVVATVEALNRLPDVRAEVATTDADGRHGRILAKHSNGMPVHHFPRTWSEQWKYSTRLGQWLRGHVAEYDIIDIQGMWSYSTWAASRRAGSARVPYLVRPHGMLSSYTWQRSRLKKAVYWRLIERRTIERASACLVTSGEEADEVRALKPDAKTFLIRNGVEEVAFSSSGNERKLRQLCGIGIDGLPIVLFLSRLHPKKGIVDRLIPALARMRTRCHLAIVGEEDTTSTGYSFEIQKALKQFQVEDRVSLLGAINGNDRWALYDGATAFVLPSHSENFGIVVGEAMARGCPVVVTKEVQSAELVRQAQAGFVVDGIPERIAESLDSFVCDKLSRTKASESGKAFARSHLRWSNVASELRLIYKQVLSDNK